MRRETVQSVDFPTTSSDATSWREMQTILCHIPRRLDPQQERLAFFDTAPTMAHSVEPVISRLYDSSPHLATQTCEF
jgi:hypothetical protein